MENCQRVASEIEKKEADIVRLVEEAQNGKEDANKKRGDIEEIKKTMIASDDNFATLEKRLKEALEQKDAMNRNTRDFSDREKRSQTAFLLWIKKSTS